MRQAGTLSNREEAQRFADYLLTQGISARVEPDADRFAVWVRDEDHLRRARVELTAFLAEPQAQRYQNVDSTASAVRKRQLQDERQRSKNFVELRDRWNTRPGGPHPLTLILIAISVFVFVASDFGAKIYTPLMRSLTFVDPGRIQLPAAVSNLAVVWNIEDINPGSDIERGQIWRLVTPAFIHFGMLHIVFNMYWVYSLGGLIEVRRGTWRFGLLVLVLAIASNCGQAFIPYFFDHQAGIVAAHFGGMSGVLYGLFGYVWMKSRFQPQEAMFLPPFTVEMLLIWLVLCWSGVFGSIANWAHTVGLVVGMAIGYAPVAWQKLIK